MARGAWSRHLPPTSEPEEAAPVTAQTACLARREIRRARPPYTHIGDRQASNERYAPIGRRLSAPGAGRAVPTPGAWQAGGPGRRVRPVRPARLRSGDHRLLGGGASLAHHGAGTRSAAARHRGRGAGGARLRDGGVAGRGVRCGRWVAARGGTRPQRPPRSAADTGSGADTIGSAAGDDLGRGAAATVSVPPGQHGSARGAAHRFAGAGRRAHRDRRPRGVARARVGAAHRPRRVRVAAGGGDGARDPGDRAGGQRRPLPRSRSAAGAGERADADSGGHAS